MVPETQMTKRLRWNRSGCGGVRLKMNCVRRRWQERTLHTVLEAGALSAVGCGGRSGKIVAGGGGGILGVLRAAANVRDSRTSSDLIGGAGAVGGGGAEGRAGAAGGGGGWIGGVQVD